MRTEKLAIYIDTQRLLEDLYSALLEMNKRDRVVIGDKMLQLNTEMFAHISLANLHSDKRVEHIDNFSVRFESFKALARLCNQKGLIQDKMALRLFDNIARIESGIGRWRNYALSRQ